MSGSNVKYYRFCNNFNKFKAGIVKEDDDDAVAISYIKGFCF